MLVAFTIFSPFYKWSSCLLDQDWYLSCFFSHWKHTITLQKWTPLICNWLKGRCRDVTVTLYCYECLWLSWGKPLSLSRAHLSSSNCKGCNILGPQLWLHAQGLLLVAMTHTFSKQILASLSHWRPADSSLTASNHHGHLGPQRFNSAEPPPRPLHTLFLFWMICMLPTSRSTSTYSVRYFLATAVWLTLIVLFYKPPTEVPAHNNPVPCTHVIFCFAWLLFFLDAVLS